MIDESTDSCEELRLPPEARQALEAAEQERRKSAPAPAPASGLEAAIIGGHRIREELGEGGMGKVYLAIDPRDGIKVALKTISKVSPDRIRLFQNEFRALADVFHRNLVVLEELRAEPNALPFFTMEYVPGQSWDDFVKTADPDRLRGAFRQLAEGLNALHESGKLHRDLKPGNVRVAPDGRVVILDFGLVLDLGAGESASRSGGGTWKYMSPEQADDQPLGPSSDWYGVGLMLHQALTGEHYDFRQGEPPAIAAEIETETEAQGNGGSRSPGPRDLLALCERLLRLRPEDRPTGAEVLRCLGAARHRPTAAPRLIGREPQLQALQDAYQAADGDSTPIVVPIQAAPGSGKTALLETFLRSLRGRYEAIVLSSRCLEQELIPFKGVSGLIDGLADLLGRMGDKALAFLPDDVVPLARTFPALRQVEAIDRTSAKAQAMPRPSSAPDPREERRRMFAAFRQILLRLSTLAEVQKRIVLAIDDWQWGDWDSVEFLESLLHGPNSPVHLLLIGQRPDDGPGSVPRIFAERVAASSTVLPMVLEPLSPDDAARLAREALGESPESRDRGAVIARESGGNPFFVLELARSASSDGAGDAGGQGVVGASGLQNALWSRIQTLSAPARRLLEIVAVAGQPLDRSVVFQAAELREDRIAARQELRIGRLIRGTAEGWIETYHDQVRETVQSRLSPQDRRSRHESIALVLEGQGGADPEILARHFLGAERLEPAARYFRDAARSAYEALAFDRAVSHYRQALRVGDWTAAEIQGLREGLGDALAKAGHSADAAHEYQALADAERGDVSEMLRYRRLAAMQLLISGRIEPGLEQIAVVLKAVGLRIPSSPRRALAPLLWNRFLLRLGIARLGNPKTAFESARSRTLDPRHAHRIESGWTGAMGLSVVDTIVGASFQAWTLRMALRHGGPRELARSLALEAAHLGSYGVRWRGSALQRLEQARQVSKGRDDPYAEGMILLGAGVMEYLCCEWTRASQVCESAVRTFRERCSGVAWETKTATVFGLWGLSHQGRIAELARRLPDLLEDAKQRGDRYAEMNLSTYLLAVVRLAEDRPEDAMETLRNVSGAWPQTGYHVQHNDFLWAELQILLYSGRGLDALKRLEERWPALAGSMLLMVQFIKIAMLSLRARCLLSAALETGDPEPLRRRAARDARKLRRERTPWSVPAADAIEAAIAAGRGDRSAASSSLRRAASGFDQAEMALWASASRMRLGELQGDDEGRAIRDSAEQTMRDQGVLRPDRFANVYISGFPDR